MKSLFSGIWVYFLTLFFVYSLGIFFLYQKAHPLSDLQTLTKLKAQQSITAQSPCFNALAGEPSILPGDSYLKINISCPDGTFSTNILKYSALPKDPNLFDTLAILEQVNNIKIQYSPDNQIDAIANIKNTSDHKWRVNINSAVVESDFSKIKLIPNNVVAIIYEKI